MLDLPLTVASAGSRFPIRSYVVRYAKIAIRLAIGLICTSVIVAVLAQRKCSADTLLYALSFDCSTVKGVIRFMIFWKPAFFPYHPHLD